MTRLTLSVRRSNVQIVSLEHFGVIDNHLFFYQLPTNLGLADEARDPFVSPRANWWAIIITISALIIIELLTRVFFRARVRVRVRAR